MSARPSTAIAARAIEYAGLGALVGGSFLAIVVGVGAGLDPPDPGLTLAAVALLAVTFEPARRRLRSLANRVVYGHRTSPLEAVRRLAVQMGHDLDPPELLEELARVVRAGTGASRVVIWLRTDTAWVAAAASPDEPSVDAVAADGTDLPRLGGADMTVPVRHAGGVLGAIAVTKSGPGVLTGIEERLVADLASHAGIVTRTMQLRESLHRRLEVSLQQRHDLVASRARLVAAQDDERRRLERDIHDTCQQQAVVLAARLGLVGVLATDDPAKARTVLDEAAADVNRLASTLARLTLASPIPELVADGLGAALRVETATAPVPVEIEDRLERRHDPVVEATAYFCCMEAIQNATKHAQAERIQVRLSEYDRRIAVHIIDDGVGFDVDLVETGTGLRNISDRLRSVDGRLVIHSSATGTEVCVEIPVTANRVPS
jgi:signal transduction histidine kinase